MQLVQKFIENTGRSPMYVGNTMIPPGEGRLVSVAGDPAAPEEPAEPSPVDLVRELLAGNVKSVVAALPSQTIAALDLILDIEGSGGTPRKGVLEAVRAEQVYRADQKLRDEQAQERAAALASARDELAAATLALDALPDTTPHAERATAQAAVDEARAKVAALDGDAQE